jgi:mannose-6-phosphate isomerase-like protein (cupin superfamily)
MNTANAGRILSHNEGQPIWYLGGLMNIKLGAEHTGGKFSLIEELIPAGTATPYHIHHKEDEIFYVLEGEAEFVLDGRLIPAVIGTLVLLPHSIPHGFRIVGEQPARLLNMLYPSNFEQLFIEAGEPAASFELPPPSIPDMDKIIAVSKKIGIEILGPLDKFIAA